MRCGILFLPTIQKQVRVKIYKMGNRMTIAFKNDDICQVIMLEALIKLPIITKTVREKKYCQVHSGFLCSVDEEEQLKIPTW